MSEPGIRSYQIQPWLSDPAPREMRLEKVGMVGEDFYSAEGSEGGETGIEGTGEISQGGVVVTHYVL